VAGVAGPDRSRGGHRHAEHRQQVGGQRQPGAKATSQGPPGGFPPGQAHGIRPAVSGLLPHAGVSYDAPTRRASGEKS
jgi:hypothetical protein